MRAVSQPAVDVVLLDNTTSEAGIFQCSKNSQL
jgi:hypothetical protein